MSRLQRVALRRVHRRVRQVRGTVVDRGSRWVVARVLRGLADRISAEGAVLSVRPADVRAADPSNPPPRRAARRTIDGRLTVNWIMSPPGPGSGGHTTAFRLIQHLQDRGHECRVYLDAPAVRRAADFAPEVRAQFPAFDGLIAGATDGMADADAVFATAWETAFRAQVDPCAGKRFYLVQDFEPWFYAPGGMSALAESTYRMGFHAVTAGRFLAEKLRAEFGMNADPFDFGCDSAIYRRSPATERTGVVFYARRHSPRRAFELGRIALELLRQAHPELTVHLYGDDVSDLGPGFVSHGVLSPRELNELYNRCYAGLALSMTNVSLVPWEMLSAGCIPVVNDAPQNRAVLDNPHVRYASAEPHALAAALASVVEHAGFASASSAAAASVQGASWRAAGETVEKVLLRELT